MKRLWVELLCVHFFLTNFGRCLGITELMINEQVRDKEIRLISETGEQLGIMSSREAQKIADEKHLDLVKISPAAKPPVCRIMDYGKYRFEQAKKEKEARKKQKTMDIKELRLSPNIDTHDVQVKVKKALEFLSDGNKVKVSIRFRGREIGHSRLGVGILEDFAAQVAEVGVVDKPPKMEARSMIMFLAPKPQKAEPKAKKNSQEKATSPAVKKEEEQQNA